MDVMNVLWRLGSGTVSEVQKGLSDELAYTTVLTILRTLEKKGHTRKLFSGSPELLMAHLLNERGLTEEQLRRLRALVDERLKED